VETFNSLSAPCHNESTCPNCYYLSKQDNLLRPCDKSCIGCVDSSKNCLACAAGYYKIKDQSGICFDFTPEGYYLVKISNQRVYQKCDSTCKTCTKRPKNCLECASDFYPKIGFNSICINKNTPVDGFYLNIDSAPIAFYPCPPSCKGCVSPFGAKGACMECATGFFFKEGTVGKEICYNALPKTNYYLNSVAGLFKTCDSKCAECSEAGESNCTKCITGFYFVEDNYLNGKGKCTNISPGPNYYLNIYTFRKCNSACFSCQNGTALDCTSCSKDFYNINPETSSPPTKFGCYKEVKDLPTQNYYLSVSAKAFIKCDSSCKTCENGNSCKECNSNFFMISGITESKCYAVVIGKIEEQGYYFDNLTKLFTPCNSNCKTCVGPRDDQCKSCWNDKMSYFLEKEEFFYPSGFDFLTDTYTPPANLIGQSRAPDVGKCLGLSVASVIGFSLYPVDNVWVKCKPNCQICQNSKNENDCLKCTAGYRISYILDSSSTFTCYKSPPDNFYIDVDNLVWFGKCHSSCKKCSGKEVSQCLDCAIGYYKDPNNSFPTNCYASKTNNSVKDNLLSKCLISCKECGTDSKKCTICANSYYPKSDEVNLAERECFYFKDKVISYYFSDPYFMKCNQYCKYCVGGSGEKQCSECAENAYPIDTELTQLQTALSKGTTPAAYIKCFPNKPDVNYWLDVNLKAYRKCSENCLECANSSENSCLKCAQDFFFKIDYNVLGDQCYQLNSPPGDKYFLSNNLWQECDKTGGTGSNCTISAKNSKNNADNRYFYFHFFSLFIYVIIY